MFVFHCHQCRETFRVAPENLYRLRELHCQNCGLPFPEEAVAKLKIIGQAYRDCIDILYKSAGWEVGWSISIAELPTKRPRSLSSPLADFEDRPDSYWDSLDYDAELAYADLKPRK